MCIFTYIYFICIFYIYRFKNFANSVFFFFSIIANVVKTTEKNAASERESDFLLVRAIIKSGRQFVFNIRDCSNADSFSSETTFT